MKKIIALVLAAMMLLACCNVLADEMPEKKYPDLDFGGATVVIYDWWSGDGAVRLADPDEDTQKLYDYRDWVNETYNVNIVEKALSDWAGNSTELANMVMNADNSKLCVVAVASDFAGSALGNKLYAPWMIDVADHFNKLATEFMTTADGKVYGVTPGKNEPRSCIFFNKRVLEEAGIDYTAIKTWDDFKEAGIDQVFVQDNQSASKRGVLRGLHFQINYPQDKLVRVISGEVFDVAVDLRKESDTYGEWVGEILSEENGIFADRLLTAIELGVPFSRIESYMGSTVDAAIAVLKKHFPYTNKDFLSQCATEYLDSWHRLAASTEDAMPGHEASTLQD